jgi:hypothetical protein
MGTLAFFPWMTVAERAQIGDVILTPYEVRESPAAGDPTAKIISMYKEMNRRTIRSATLVQVAGKELTADLDEDGRDLIFRHAAAIAFSGLSKRSFFDHVDYCNSDSFQCIVQQFTDAKFISIVTRRRDGTTSNGISTDLYQVDQEPHVERLKHHRVDAQLVDGLLKGMSQDPDFDLAIRHFINANTDRPSLSPADEMVSTVSAFERLLKVKGGNTNKTRIAFLKALAKIPALEPISDGRDIRNKKLLKWDGLRGVWIEDLCVVRGNLAHGHRADAHPSSWSRQEHLLLAAFIFPLLAKLRLQQLGLYKLIDEDESALHSIDYLIGAKALFKTGEDEYGMPIFGWVEALKLQDDHSRRAVIESAWEKLRNQT